MNRASAPGYDLFKLGVTLVLILILVLMLLRGCATTSASPLPTEDSSVLEPTQSGVVASASETMEPTATATAAATDTPALESTTPTPDASPPIADVTQTPEATATEPATAESTPTTTAADGTSCNTSVPSRLSVGQTARVAQRLNMRNAATILAPILVTSSVNTQVEIIGGPVCTPVGEGAYLWWQIRTPGGAEGWSAESPLNEATYLLEPVP